MPGRRVEESKRGEKVKTVSKILLLRNFTGKGSRKICLQLKEEMRSREVVDMIVAVLKTEDT